MRLRCRTLGDKCGGVYVTIHPGMKVNDLKREIADIFHTTIKGLLLFFNERYLDENCNLDRYDFTNNNEIEVKIMPRDFKITRVRPVGVFPGIRVGEEFSRDALFNIGFHRAKRRGIYAYSKGYAYSIILAGEYEGDMDLGDRIIYTGERGPNPDERTMASTTRALARNCTEDLNEIEGAVSRTWRRGVPVRVLKKTRDNTYRYVGIYKVKEYRPERYTSDQGRIQWRWRFTLKRDPTHVETFYVSH